MTSLTLSTRTEVNAEQPTVGASSSIYCKGEATPCKKFETSSPRLRASLTWLGST